MMNVDKLMPLIDIALKEVNNIVNNSSYLTFEHFQIKKTIKILELLKVAIEENPSLINERVLRGAHDLGMYSFKYFENTPLEEVLCCITQILYDEIPHFKNLEPLGLDFGKKNPI